MTDKKDFQFGPSMDDDDEKDTFSDDDDHSTPIGGFPMMAVRRVSVFGRTESANSDLDEIGKPLVAPPAGSALRRMDSADSDLDEIGKPLQPLPASAAAASKPAASKPMTSLSSVCFSANSKSSHMSKSSITSVTPSLSPAEVSEMPDRLIKHVVWTMERCSKSTFLDAEFKHIHDYDSRFYSIQRSDASRLPQNVQKNRYLNVPSYDEWRVKLNEIPGVPGSDYINASWITDIDGDEAKERHRFIATQGPMTDYLQDFWRMIWEENVNIIVFLGKEIEKGYRKVDRYWPDGDSKNSLRQNPWDKSRYDAFLPSFNQPEVHKKNMVLPPLTVEAVKEEVVPGCEIVKRTFNLYNSDCPGEVREVYQYQYGGWPDQGAPASSHDIRTLVNEVRNLHEKDELPRPIVVHCSAGIGRTGAFCTIYVYMQNILMYMDKMKLLGKLAEVQSQSRRKAEASDFECSAHDRDYGSETLTFNISATVLSLRKRRIGMVQNPEQYKFCYKAIVDELRKQGFLPPLKDLPDAECTDNSFETEALSSNTVIPVLGTNSNFVEDVERTRFSASSSLLSSSGFASESVASQIRQLSKNPRPAEKPASRPASLMSFPGNPLLSGSTGPVRVRRFPPLGGLHKDSDNDDFQPLRPSRAVDVSQPSSNSSAVRPGDLACNAVNDDEIPVESFLGQSFSEPPQHFASSSAFK